MVNDQNSSDGDFFPEVASSAATWARTASFERPIRFEDVENAVLDSSVPGLDAKASFGMHSVRQLLVVGVFALAPVVGLVCVMVMRAATDAQVREFAGIGLLYSFLIAAGVLIASASIWGQTGRPRNLLGIIHAGVSGVIGAVSFALFRTTDYYGGDTASFFIRLLTGLSAVLGVGLCVAMLFGSSASPKKKRRRTFHLGASQEMKLIVGRNAVLDVLRERGLVSLDDRAAERIASMPLGTWSDVDGQGQ